MHRRTLLLSSASLLAIERSRHGRHPHRADSADGRTAERGRLARRWPRDADVGASRPRLPRADRRRSIRRARGFRSVIELNPEAIAIARGARRRAQGRPCARRAARQSPCLVKDNIATGDRMSTSAGSLALDGVRAPRDAHVVKRLRDAGAVILGKTNLSEWANIRSTRSTSGWSARGGLTRNPYALDRNTSGSSSGTAAAIAAGLHRSASAPRPTARSSRRRRSAGSSG
jgi:amidase